MNNNDKALSDKSLEKVGGGKNLSKHENTAFANMINIYGIPINCTGAIENYWGSVEHYKEVIENKPNFLGYDKKGIPIWKDENGRPIMK
jgi:hypothetical protein